MNTVIYITISSAQHYRTYSGPQKSKCTEKKTIQASRLSEYTESGHRAVSADNSDCAEDKNDNAENDTVPAKAGK